MVTDQTDDSRAAKRRLRERLVANRARRPDAERERASEALCSRVLALPEVEGARTVACYVSLPAEPGTGPLLTALAARRCPVLLPLLGDDLDLSWALFEPGALRSARFGLREPTGTPLGVDAIATAAVVICPALAVDGTGHRLGRGGGSYDRALGRLSPDVLRVALLYDDEVLSDVPAERHDEPVNAVVTPARVLRL